MKLLGPDNLRTDGATLCVRARPWWLVAVGVLLVALAAALLDGPVSRRVLAGQGYLVVKRSDWAAYVKWPGVYWFTLVMAGVVAFSGRGRWRGAVLIATAPALGAVFYSLAKWIVGRSRPLTGNPLFSIDPFRFGLRGLFHNENQAFPSGHACLAFSTAAALTLTFPRLWWLFYPFAVAVGIERIAEGAHYPSDVVAGALMGTLATLLTARWLGPLRKSVDESSVVPTSVDADAGRDRSALREHRMSMNSPGSADGSGADGPYLSLIIPVYNEAENVPELLRRCEVALRAVGRSFEVIVSDDGSTDGTSQLLAEALAERPWLRVLRLARNRGQSAALAVGFKAARGQVLATIDGDLQNDPEEIPRLLPMLDEGYDMITGWRKQRNDAPFRRLQTRVANRVRNWISDETIQDSASSLKVYKRQCVEGLQMYNGMHRFMPTLVKLRGFKVLETPVKHSQRHAGTAKYGLRNRALRAFIDLLAVRWMKERWLQCQCEEVQSVTAEFGARSAESALEKSNGALPKSR